MGREDQLLAVVTASCVDEGGWDAQALSTLVPAAIMTGAEVTVYDQEGQQIWSTADSAMGVTVGSDTNR